MGCFTVTQTEQQTLAVVGLLGVAAFLLLRQREQPTAPRAYTPIYGTGTALREPTPYVPIDLPAPEKPGFFERAWETIKEAVTPEPVSTQPKSPSQWRAELQPLFRRMEESYAMPHKFLEAVADRESRFRNDIITCELIGKAGEEGIMQLKPQFHLSSRAERCNPNIAIPYAAKYLAKNYLRFGTWEEAVAAYNWGPTNLESYGLQASPAATKEYIAWVRARAAPFV